MNGRVVRTEEFRGLSYILHKFDNKEHVSTKDVLVFMKDLGLPPMHPQRVHKEMRIAGGTPIPFTSVIAFRKLPQFLTFIKNNVKKNLSKRALDGFKRFDEEPGALRSKRSWDEVGGRGTFTVDELKRILQEFGTEGGDFSDEEVELVMQVVDLDEDGKINYKQLLEKMKHL